MHHYPGYTEGYVVMETKLDETGTVILTGDGLGSHRTH
jgi:hypothetical protein